MTLRTVLNREKEALPDPIVKVNTVLPDLEGNRSSPSVNVIRVVKDHAKNRLSDIDQQIRKHQETIDQLKIERQTIEKLVEIVYAE